MKAADSRFAKTSDVFSPDMHTMGRIPEDASREQKTTVCAILFFAGSFQISPHKLQGEKQRQQI